MRLNNISYSNDEIIRQLNLSNTINHIYRDIDKSIYNAHGNQK